MGGVGMTGSEMMPVTAPLYQALCGHLAAERESMHTPGHKGRAELLSRLDMTFDLTELPDTDSLYEASGAIARAEQLTARAFGAGATAFSAGGCTLAIQSMLRCCCVEGDAVIMSRVSHRSAVNACALLGLKPIWLWPEKFSGAGIPGQVTADGIRASLLAHPTAAAVYITSPDYFGCMADVEGIASVCRSAGIPLLVDNAHGSHLIAFDRMHPLCLGAAMTADSAHKTLPVLTGGAWLHCSAQPEYNELRGRMKSAMALFGSTSPSYLTMASLDLCRDWLENEGKAGIKRVESRCIGVRKAAECAGLRTPHGLCDPARITLLTEGSGVDGGRLGAYLRERGFEPELVCHSAVVLLPSPFTPDEAFDRLETAVCRLPADMTIKSSPEARFPAADLRPVQVMQPREAILAERESIPTVDAAGRIAAQVECPCPPGVPIIMPGEMIDDRVVSELLACKVDRTDVILLSNRNL